MKMQQEIDAMQTMGVDPFEAIVLPRFIALFVMVFLLTFLGAVAGLFAFLLSAKIAKLPAFDPTGTMKSLTFADPNYWASNLDSWTKQWDRVSKGA